MLTEEEKLFLSRLQESEVITAPDKNLRSKIDSILRSIENLSEKKIRIEYEIRKQKKSLVRKRQELKKVTGPNQKKLTVTLESDTQAEAHQKEQLNALFRRIDSKLLQESSQVLDN